MVKAPIVKRIVAYLIDVILISLVSTVTGLGGGFIGSMLGNKSGSLGGLVVILVVLATLVVSFGYLLLRDGLFGGRSLGKKLMGLRVMNTVKNTPCSYKDSIFRNITLCIPLVSTIDLILAVVDTDGKRIGDKIAKTQVLGLDQQVTPAADQTKQQAAPSQAQD